MKDYLKRLMRREIDAQREIIVGKVLSQPIIANFDGAGAGVFVADVEIGSNNFLKEVPIKALGKNRFHAHLGQTVALRRNAQGRYEIIGPGDRLSQPVSVQKYDLTARATSGSATNVGFRAEVLPHSYYATLDGAAPLGVKWADGVTPYNYVRIVDANGVPV